MPMAEMAVAGGAGTGVVWFSGLQLVKLEEVNLQKRKLPMNPSSKPIFSESLVSHLVY